MRGFELLISLFPMPSFWVSSYRLSKERNDYRLSKERNDYRLSKERNDYRLSKERNDYRLPKERNDYRLSKERNDSGSKFQEVPNDYRGFWCNGWNKDR
jgi:hypothetical protein